MAKIKGTAVLATVKALRKNKEAAAAALPAHLRRYIEQRILVSTWYPEEEILELWRALAKILPSEGGDVYETMGGTSAREVLSSIYRHILRPGDPMGTLKHGSIIWQAYHDTGRFRVTPQGAGHAEFDLVGYGLPSEDMCRINTGWFGELLRMAGASDVELSHTRCCCRGDELCTWEAKWKEPEAS